MTPEDLKAWALVMTQFKVLKCNGTAGDPNAENAEDICIEMDPSAFAAVASEAPAVPKDLGAGEPKCACGHLRDSEHNNDGLCIAGACPVAVCHPEATGKSPAV